MESRGVSTPAVLVCSNPTVVLVRFGRGPFGGGDLELTQLRRLCCLLCCSVKFVLKTYRSRGWFALVVAVMAAPP